MRIWIAWLALLIAGGCVGDAPPDSERRCDGSDYDPCLQEHDCMSTNCRFLGSLQVCTVGCTAGDNSTCPTMFDGRTVTCDPELSVCKPPAANPCTRR